jgi:hypothetical protein
MSRLYIAPIQCLVLFDPPIFGLGRYDRNWLANRIKKSHRYFTLFHDNILWQHGTVAPPPRPLSHPAPTGV